MTIANVDPEVIENICQEITKSITDRADRLSLLVLVDTPFEEDPYSKPHYTYASLAWADGGEWGLLYDYLLGSFDMYDSAFGEDHPLAEAFGKCDDVGDFVLSLKHFIQSGGCEDKDWNEDEFDLSEELLSSCAEKGAGEGGEMFAGIDPDELEELIRKAEEDAAWEEHRLEEGARLEREREEATEAEWEAAKEARDRRVDEFTSRVSSTMGLLTKFAIESIVDKGEDKTRVDKSPVEILLDELNSARYRGKEEDTEVEGDNQQGEDEAEDEGVSEDVLEPLRDKIRQSIWALLDAAEGDEGDCEEACDAAEREKCMRNHPSNYGKEKDENPFVARRRVIRIRFRGV